MQSLNEGRGRNQVFLDQLASRTTNSRVKHFELRLRSATRAYISTPNYLRKGARSSKDSSAQGGLEVFDTGIWWFVRQLIKET